jgi:hypothetical protein
MEPKGSLRLGGDGPIGDGDQESLRSATQSARAQTTESDMIRALLAEVGRRCPFESSFFLHRLGTFVRERCPDPSEHLPSVQIHLTDGAVLALCHVIAVAPRWVALATRFPNRASSRMWTEIVPYEAIARLTVSAADGCDGGIGFEQQREPEIVAEDDTPLDTLRSAAGLPTATEPDRSGDGVT